MKNKIIFFTLFLVLVVFAVVFHYFVHMHRIYLN